MDTKYSPHVYEAQVFDHANIDRKLLWEKRSTDWETAQAMASEFAEIHRRPVLLVVKRDKDDTIRFYNVLPEALTPLTPTRDNVKGPT